MRRPIACKKTSARSSQNVVGKVIEDLDMESCLVRVREELA